MGAALKDVGRGALANEERTILKVDGHEKAFALEVVGHSPTFLTGSDSGVVPASSAWSSGLSRPA